mmetsp:Transcript_12481/g.25924  ORF Transcript_12481/g.25924 Transcript_12481/m.25924 type:complete len:355 (-) Transcript_12481:117-1181(-)
MGRDTRYHGGGTVALLCIPLVPSWLTLSAAAFLPTTSLTRPMQTRWNYHPNESSCHHDGSAVPSRSSAIGGIGPLTLRWATSKGDSAAESPSDPSPPFPIVPTRERTKLQGKLPIISRTVPLGIFLDEGEEISATVWEVEHPSEMMEMWWSAGASDKGKIGDPFGVVMWPGSILAAQEMARHRDVVAGKTVLLLGAGTGLEAQAAACIGANRVIATDISKLVLKLLNYGAERAGLGDIIEGRVFDLFSEEELPDCDVVVAADVLYNELLGMQMGLRCTEILSRPNPPKLIVTDSQRFHGTDFLPFVNAVLEKEGKPQIQWEEHKLEGFTGSGMLVEGDQTYDVTARMLSIGWDT